VTRLRPERFVGLAAICVSTFLPTAAWADTESTGTLTFSDGAYHFTFPKKLFEKAAGVNLAAPTPTLLPDIKQVECGNIQCVDADAVHTFFQTPRPATMSYLVVGTAEMPVVEVRSITLINQSDVSALQGVVAQAFPTTVQPAPTATFGAYVSLVNGACVYTAQAQANRSQSGPDSPAYTAMSQCDDYRDKERLATLDAEASRGHEAEQAQEAAALRAHEAEMTKQAAIAAAKAKHDEQQSGDDFVREAARALPAHRKEIALALPRCIKLLSASDCGTVRVDSLLNYKADFWVFKSHAGLCEDRREYVGSTLYQAKLLTGGVMDQGSSAMVDSMLGEMIDNCPDSAAMALQIRRSLANL
jgi:hypothetical protein